MNAIRVIASIYLIMILDKLITNELPITTIVLVSVLLLVAFKTLDDLVSK